MVLLIVSGHYHSIRDTAIVHAVRRGETVGVDNTGIGVKSQMVGIILIPIHLQQHGSSIGHCLQLPISGVGGVLLPSSPGCTEAGLCLTSDAFSIRSTADMVSTESKQILYGLSPPLLLN